MPIRSHAHTTMGPQCHFTTISTFHVRRTHVYRMYTYTCVGFAVLLRMCEARRPATARGMRKTLLCVCVCSVLFALIICAKKPGTMFLYIFLIYIHGGCQLGHSVCREVSSRRHPSANTPHIINNRLEPASLSAVSLLLIDFKIIVGDTQLRLIRQFR